MSYLAPVAFGLLALCALMSAPRAADAAVKTASIGVSAIVVDTCSVAVSGGATSGSACCMKETPYRVVTSRASVDAYAASNDTGSTEASSNHVKTQNINTRVTVVTFVF
jgi:hypothetical protein